MALIVNQYRTVVTDTTSTGAFLGIGLAFDAGYIRISNGGTVSLRVTFNSTVASTNDAEIRPGELLECSGGPTSKFSLLTTSTSTDGSDHRRARVLALGG